MFSLPTLALLSALTTTPLALATFLPTNTPSGERSSASNPRVPGDSLGPFDPYSTRSYNATAFQDALRSYMASQNTSSSSVDSRAYDPIFTYTKFEMHLYTEYNYWGFPKDDHDVEACFYGGAHEGGQEICQRFKKTTLDDDKLGRDKWYDWEFPAMPHSWYALHCGNYCYDMNAGRFKKDNLWMDFNGVRRNAPEDCAFSHVYREWQSPNSVKTQNYRWEKVTCGWENIDRKILLTEHDYYPNPPPSVQK